MTYECCNQCDYYHISDVPEICACCERIKAEKDAENRKELNSYATNS